jgi:peptidoglycan/LPS O-acetylase OafA/YrhL
MNRIPSLDGARAIAIAMVVWGHWAEVRFQSPIAGAYASLGRRIFFVLSGYLITILLMKEYDRNVDDRAAEILCAAGVPDFAGGDFIQGAGICDLLA